MYYPYVQQMTRQKRRVMTVTGIGKVSVTPDTVQIQLEVSTENKTLSEAQQENARVMSQVINSLVEFGVNRENIKTVSYHIFPQYDYVEGEQVFRGYEVTNAIVVTSTEIDQIGKLIDIAVENGVNRVSNIQFTVSNEQLEYQQALRLALRNATAKAQTIAETMQFQFDTIPIKIVEQFTEPPAVYRSLSTVEQYVSTPIEQGQITISATVKVQFQY